MENNIQKKMWEELTEQTTLNELQLYFKKIFLLRGFRNQTVNQKLLLLMEEVGELAKATRMENPNIGVDISRIDQYGTVQNEIADVFIVLLSICIEEKIDLMDAVKRKEKKNTSRCWIKE